MLTENYLHRFGGIARLYGQDALEKLHAAHFAVIGLGGVGSWLAEALARTGIGELTLVELDEICITNTNRQLPAMQSTIGKSKNETLTNRLKDINPEITVHSVNDFLTANNLKEVIGKQHHVVLDAMDSAHMKARLVAYCSKIKIRLIVVGSSGGKTDPTQIRASDLGHTVSDPMLAKVRQQLYRHHNFSRDKNRKFRIDAVYSTEQMIYPKPDGSVCMDKSFLDNGVKLDCAGGMGSVSMVTGSFAFVAAARAIERYLGLEKKN